MLRSVRLGLVLLSLVAVALLLWFGWQWLAASHSSSSHAPTADREIAYWVAPMDPNYRRSEPGKSPMGMDLVPVYADQVSDTGPGEVKVAEGIRQALGLRTVSVIDQVEALPLTVAATVMLDEEGEHRLFSREQGWVEQLHVGEGDQVQAGALLYHLFSPELVAAQRDYLNALSSGSAARQNGARLRLRALGMAEQDVASLRRRGQVFEQVPVRASMSGQVSQLALRVGSQVRREQMTLTLVDTSKLQAALWLPESEATTVAEGSEVLLSFAGVPGKPFHSQLQRRQARVNPLTRSVELRVPLADAQGLLPGMQGQAEIQRALPEGALLIPQSAVLYGADSDHVVRVEGDILRPQPVRLGISSGDRVAVLEGLSKGDRIVSRAQFLIDSESSLSAELDRLSAAKDNEVEEEDDPAVTVTGTIKEVAPRRLVIDHPPVPQWNWPQMVMPFALAEGVSSDGLQAGQRIRFSMVRDEQGRARITALEVVND